MTKKTMTLPDFLTAAQIDAAVALYITLRGTGRFAAEVDRQIIAPNMAAINEKLGQENDSRYLAYAVEMVLSQAPLAQPQGATDDVCAYCGTVIGRGIPAFHLGVCDKCRDKTPDARRVH